MDYLRPTLMLLLLSFSLSASAQFRNSVFLTLVGPRAPAVEPSPCSSWIRQEVSFSDQRAILHHPTQFIENTLLSDVTVCKVRLHWSYVTGQSSYVQIRDSSNWGGLQIGGNSVSVVHGTGWTDYIWAVNKPVLLGNTSFFITPRTADDGAAGDALMAGGGYDDDDSMLVMGVTEILGQDLMFEIFLE